MHRAPNPWYEVRLIEGRKNQIREMFKHFGRLVEKLKRVKIGFLELGPLKPGEFRYLTAEEVKRFRRSATGKKGDVPSPPLKEKGPNRPAGVRARPARSREKKPAS
jgi:23S rRNA pseudouridine2605 synthase